MNQTSFPRKHVPTSGSPQLPAWMDAHRRQVAP